MRRVAEEVGVSRMTVSNAYNRPDQLSAALRRRIFEAAGRLGYAGPDPLGRGLSRGRAGTIGVLLGGGAAFALDDPAAVGFLRGVAEAAEEEGLATVLVPRLGGGGPSPARDATTRDATAAAGTMADGFLARGVDAGDPLLLAALERGEPLVIADGTRVEGVPFVGSDDAGAAGEALAHLGSLGHRSFAIVRAASGPEEERAALLAWQEALRRSGAPEARVLVLEEGPSGSFGGLRGLAEALAHPEGGRPTALLATGSRPALGAMSVASDGGWRVPEDLSVAGFAEAALSAAVVPPLTAVERDQEEKGRAAVRLLVGEIEGHETAMGAATEATTRLVPGRLVLGGSTGPARAAG